MGITPIHARTAPQSEWLIRAELNTNILETHYVELVWDIFTVGKGLKASGGRWHGGGATRGGCV